MTAYSINKIPRLLLLGLTIVVLSSACKGRKNVVREIKDPVKDKNEGVEYIFNKLKDNEFRFSTLSLKFNAEAELNKDQKNSFNGHVRIIKDSVIWISITPALGIEAFRLLITVDSVKMIDRIHKTYFRGDYMIINNILKTPFDFDMLQAFITGNDFTYYENNIFKASTENLNYKLTTLGRRKLKNYVKNQVDLEKVFIQDMWLDPVNYKIIKQQIKELSKENSRLTIDYSDFRLMETQKLFPGKILVIVEAESKLQIQLEYTKIALDQEVTIPFTIPENFNPISTNQ